MAGASLIGLVIALRHGQLVAVVGLVGAFATPALVQTEAPSLPGLFAYLLFVTGTAFGVVRYAAWVWLGWATAIAGAVWMLVAIASGTGREAWAPALFAPAAAMLNLTLLPREALDQPIGRRLAWVPCAALGAAGLLLAMLDQGWDTRIAVLLFVPLTIWRAAREDRLRLLPFLAAVLFLLMLAGWSVEMRALPGIRPTVPERRRWSGSAGNRRLRVGLLRSQRTVVRAAVARSARLGQSGSLRSGADTGDLLRARGRVPAARGVGGIRRAACGRADRCSRPLEA